MLCLQLPIPTGESLKVAFKNGAGVQLVRKGDKITFKHGHTVSQGDDRLGYITSGPAGVKLQAFQTLHILPGSIDASSNPEAVGDASNERYQLEPIVDGRCEIIFLRHGDVITSPGTTSSVFCVWMAPEVQVNSSAADVNQTERFETGNSVEDTPEDETEDEATLDDTVTEVPVTQPVTQSTKSQLSATPHLPKDRSLVVHETPTANRILDHDDFNIAPSNEAPRVEATPPPHGAIAVTESFSAARAGHSPNAELPADQRRLQCSPQVAVGRSSRKRQNSEHILSLIAPAADEPPVKRKKKAAIIGEEEGDTVQASLLGKINTDQDRMTYSTKAKRRAATGSEVTPTNSLRSSQRSATATTVAAYEGPIPRVATSNSAIKEDSSAVKFLRKQGGALVKNVEDKCNVLCIRDHGLAKTMKFIQAIALGVPIVTDKWLTESAKADGFLELASFKPSVTQQEKEWKFNLEQVWGVAQTPFKGFAIYFTLALKKTYTNFREMEKACQTLGAKVVPKRTSKNDTIIVLATDDGDPEAEEIIEDGDPCYQKDLLTTSILRGNLDLDSDEFKIKAKQVGPRRKGQRKST
ncbi:uncharacterized protein M421DRAFT_421470 [Didymella exigua CBS 183.55]|uniref:BRCT domain-containing protein n=1 Tax=Didymella exigua CBS 183.55 TaxID=1150837 RepID=A0A6A5RMQ4_9PLEO|nr:uncharacterized protein M421DRAFT_421470 [Didymella exigua CBS 183.55]KAF1927626.1 hypothetical protein M421DRAFT_421470 [Didymella exigua CBS 183.55]